MQISRLGSVVVVGLILLATACNKDKNAPAGGSSATPGPVKFKGNTPANDGNYDGTKAVMADSGFGDTRIVVAKDCPSFTCAEFKSGSYQLDKLKTACPKGHFLQFEHKGPMKAGSKMTMESVVHTESNGSAVGLMIGDAKTKEIEYLSAGPPVVARLTLKGDDTIDGVVSATVCPK